MPKIFSLRIKNVLPLIFFLLIPLNNILSQEKSNLNILYDLADSSASSIIKALPSGQKDLSFNFTLGNDYELFKDHLITYFVNQKYNVFQPDKASDNTLKIDYTIDNAKITYGDPFRAGFFGNYKVQRNVKISGIFTVNKNPVFASKFNYAVSDTIGYSNIQELQSSSYSITKGDVPAEPFFSSLLEPVVAVGTAAVVIFLFFTIRSK